MLIGAKPIVISSLVTTGATGVGLTSAHFLTSETIEYSLNKILLSQEHGGKGWDRLVKKIQEQNQEIKSGAFEEIRKISEKTEKEVLKEVLKEVCRVNSQRKWKSIFFQNTDLLEDFKNYCTIKVSEMLDNRFKSNDQIIRPKEKKRIMKRLAAIKSYKKGVDRQAHLTRKLRELKRQGTISNEDSMKMFMSFCSREYRSYFTNENSNNWKLTERYCSIN